MRPAIAAAVTVAVVCTAFVFSFAFLEAPHAYAQAATSTDEIQVDSTTQTSQKSDDQAKLDGFTGVIYGFCTALGTGILWLGGMFFDYSMGYLVIGMGDLLGEGLGDMIDTIWIVVRDIFNLLFIFGLIYIGFRTILGVGKSDTQRTLIMLIAAALLVNFSLFIAKAIVDLSNVTAFQIYSLISVDGDETRVDGGYTGIGAGFMQYLNLEASIGDNAEVLQDIVADDGNLPSGRVIIYGIMVLIFSLVAAFVFMAGAVFMVTRFVALVLYMVFSPAMFAGLIFPGMGPFMHKWWRGFINNALVAPAFMFMLYLSLMAAEALQDEHGTLGKAFANPSAGDGTFMVILMFFVIMGFLIASLMVAKQLGTVGADRAVSMGKTALNKTRTGIQRAGGRAAGGAVFGSMGAVGRASLGRLARKGADSEDLKDRAAQGGWRGVAARGQLEAWRKLEDASFDPRRVGGMGKKLGIGEGAKGGYKSKEEAIAKKEKDYAKSLGEVKDDDLNVVRLKENVSATEQNIKNLKRQKSTAESKEEQAKLQNQIDDAEGTLKEQQESVKREKSRRQIGSMSKVSYGLVARRDMQKAALKKAQVEYAAANDNEREEKAKAIRDHRKIIAEMEERIKKEAGGYASTVENAAWYANMFRGRSAKHNQAAGEAIRKDTEQKVKKSKEDARFDSIGDKLAKASKKE